MRCTARLLAVLATLLTVGLGGGLLSAPAAGAQPSFRLADYVTDNAGALSDSGRSTVTAAVNKLYTDRHIRLWVVYVDDFSGQSPTGWAQGTVRASDLGGYDALLAVATTSRAYAFLVPSTIKSVNAGQVDSLRRNKIEPALHNGDWSGAAVAAANGLDASPGSSGRVILLATLAGILIALAGLLLVMRHRGQRRRAAALAAARRVDPTDVDALAALPLQTLDDLSRALVVDVDNALRTSANELDLAVGEFGEERTRPFTSAVANAKAALSQAFTVRQQLDDSTPETPAQRRELLTQVIVSAARADRELESQTEAFEKLRDLVINAASRLDALTRQYVELTTRLAPAEQRLAALHHDFSAAALTSVSGNVTTAKERLAFADRNIGTARELAAHAVTGGQAGLVDAVRAAESALGQARALLDAVDNAASDIQHAIDGLPSAVADTKDDIARANELLQKKTHAQRRFGGGPRRGHQGRRERPRRRIRRSAGRLRTGDQGRRRAQRAAGHPGRGTGHRRATQPITGTGLVHRAIAGARGVRLHRHAPRQRRPRRPHPAGRGQAPPAGRAGQGRDEPERSDRPRQCGVDAGRSRSVTGERRRAGDAARLHAWRRQ